MLPPRLFRNQTFAAALLSTSIANLIFTTLVVLIPIEYQLTGLSANEAGIRLIPFTISGAIASFAVGYSVSRLGRARIFPLVGCALLTLMCAIMALVGIGNSLASDLTITFCLGATLGFQFNPVNVLVQNALSIADNGIGISSQMFFRLMAAAFGVAVMTSLLISYLSTGAMAVPGHELLGPEPGFALLHLDLAHVDPDLRAGLRRDHPRRLRQDLRDHDGARRARLPLRAAPARRAAARPTSAPVSVSREQVQTVAPQGEGEG